MASSTNGILGNRATRSLINVASAISPSGTNMVNSFIRGVADGLSSQAPSAQSFQSIRITEEGSGGKSVVFKVTPELAEDKSVNYIEVSEIRQAASILIFIGSPGRNFSLTAKLVSRTKEEATENFNNMHLLKSWAMPSKGANSVGDSEAPRVLYLYGYGDNLKGIKIVMKSINIQYPVDVDYIPTASGNAKMPIIMPISMSFQEIHSAQELNDFTLDKYKTGSLPNW